MAEENKWKPDEDEEDEELDETVRTLSFHFLYLISISLHLVLQGSQGCRHFRH